MEPLSASSDPDSAAAAAPMAPGGGWGGGLRSSGRRTGDSKRQGEVKASFCETCWETSVEVGIAVTKGSAVSPLTGPVEELLLCRVLKLCEPGIIF